MIQWIPKLTSPTTLVVKVTLTKIFFKTTDDLRLFLF